MDHREAFDKMSITDKVRRYSTLGRQGFIERYGAERIPHEEHLHTPKREISDWDIVGTAKPKMGDGLYKDGNPKTALGIRKPSDYYTPPIPYFEYSMAHMQGAFKYGPFNWRDDPISISTYLDAAKRHMDLFRAGQRNASDTGLHHLAHAMCCLSIIMDAEAHNTLIDDRFYYRDDKGQKKPYEVLETYIQEAEPRTKRIYEEWYGHAERNKTKWAEAAKQNSGEKK